MLNSRFTVALLVIVSGASAFADQVTLKNGDRITGEIVKKDDKAVTLKSTFLGLIAVPWEQVQLLKSDAPVTVILQSGEQLQSTLEPAEGQLQLREQQRTIPQGQVAAIRNAAEQAAYERLQHPGWLNLWAGTGSFGLAGTTGNSQTRTINASVAAARVTRKDKTSIHLEAIKSTSVLNQVKSDTAQAIRGGVAYDRNLNGRLFFNTFNDYEYDRFQNLDLRTTYGGGLGLHAWKAERGFFDVLAGADYNHSHFSGNTFPLDPGFSQSSAEFFWGNDFAYKLRTATAFTQTFRMFNDLTQTGNYRVNAEMGINTRIMKWLNWNIALSDRYLSNPAPGRKTNDLVYTTGIGISFALK